MPLRERNTLLLAAGFAPAYPEHRLGDVPMAAVSTAIGQILRGHLPYPALVVDRHWNLVEANDAVAVLVDGSSPDLLEPPVNVLRLSLHPDGMAPRIHNLAQWRAHLLDRLDHQFRVTGDPQLADLHTELAGYPGGASHTANPAALIVPLEDRRRRGAAVLPQHYHRVRHCARRHGRRTWRSKPSIPPTTRPRRRSLASLATCYLARGMRTSVVQSAPSCHSLY